MAIRSEVTIDLGALRANARRLLRALAGAELWAVVKANGYGHGALDCARAALEAGASALCVATVGEALELRAALPDARLLVMGPTDELAAAREARLELCVSGPVPEGIPVHVKLDTGMGRWGIAELASPPRNVVGLMTHLATADSDPAFAREQRGGAPPPGGALRRRTLRDRLVRPLALRYGRGGGRAPARALVAERARAREAARARRVDRLRSPLRRRARDVDRDRPGRLRGRLPPRPRRRAPARRRRAVPRRRRRLDGRARGRAPRRAPGGDGGDDRRGRPPARGARARRRHDHVRARLPDRDRSGARPARRRMSRPGRSAWSQAAGRYQRGTTISRLPAASASTVRLATSSGSTTSSSQGKPIRPRCGKPGVSTKPGSTFSTCTPRGLSSTATEREKASWACFEAEYGPTANVPATEATVTTFEPSPSPGRSASSGHTEPR